MEAEAVVFVGCAFASSRKQSLPQRWEKRLPKYISALRSVWISIIAYMTILTQESLKI